MVAGLGQPPFRASQLSRHFFGRYTDQADEMSDLPRAARGPEEARRGRRATWPTCPWPNAAPW